MTTTNAIFSISLLAWLGLEAWRQFRDFRVVRTVASSGDRGTIFLTTGLTLAGIALALASANYVHWYMPWRTSLVLFWSGIAVMWLGMGLRLWAIRTLGRFFRSVVAIQEGHEVVRDGPYRWLRHPSYTGALLTGLGAGLVLGNWFSLAVIVLLALVGYLRRIQVEEAALVAGLDGAYEDYRRVTWRLVPFVW